MINIQWLRTRDYFNLELRHHQLFIIACIVVSSLFIYGGKGKQISANLQIFGAFFFFFDRKVVLLPTISNKNVMDIKDLLNRTDRFAAQAGCQITAVDERHAVAQMTVTQQHLNGGNVCQGGALFTLADLAIAALMNCRGQLTFGISNSIMFVSSAREGDVLTAEAVSVCDHKKIPSVEVRVSNQKGQLICHVTGLGYRKSETLPTGA